MINLTTLVTNQVLIDLRLNFSLNKANFKLLLMDAPGDATWDNFIIYGKKV